MLKVATVSKTGVHVARIGGPQQKHMQMIR